MNAATTPHLQEAERLYEHAREALLRPQEDIVPYQICENAYKAVKAYLQGFLAANAPQVSPSEVLEELVAQCNAIDRSFAALQLNQMFQPTSNEDVWMSLNTGRLFLDLAENTRQKVIQF